MFGRILNTLLFLAFIGAASFAAWKFFFEKKGPQLDPLTAVPENAVAFVSGENVVEFYRELDNTSLFWQDLKASGYISNFDNQLDIWNTLDKKGALKKIKEAPFVISMHPAGNNTFEYLICVSFPGKGSETVNEILKQGNISIEKFDNDLQIIKTESGIKWFYYNYENLVVFSPYKELTQNAVRECKNGKPAEEKFNLYHTLKNSKGDHIRSNLFIKNTEYINLNIKHFREDLENFLGSYATGEAGLYDIVIEPNSLLLRGFNLAPDSTDNALKLLKGQKPVKPNLLKLLPQSTSWFYYLGLSDFDKFVEKLHNDKIMRAQLEEFNSNYDVDLKRHLLSWINGELTLFAMKNYPNERMMLVQCDASSNPLGELEYLRTRLDSSGAQDVNYNGKIIKRLNEDNLFKLLLGEVFGKVNRPYYMQIENSIIFSTSAEAMTDYLNEIAADQFLVRNVQFYDDVENHFSTNTNVMFHMNYSEGNEAWMLMDSVRGRLMNGVSFVKNTESFTFSLCAKMKNLYYTQALFKYKGSASTTSNTIWDIGFDTLLQTTPHVINNHLSGTKNIIVQDKAYNIHSLSATGKTEYSIKIGEPIIDKIVNIDIHNNGKNQLLFVTASKLHLIDLKGNYVSGFPVSLKTTPTASPAAFDYESDGNYRILIPCGNKILNYNKEGKPVEGFNFAGLPGNITQAPLFARIDNKDYLFICDDAGNVKLTDRKGTERYSVNFKLKNRSVEKVNFEKGSTVETSKIIFCSNNGTIYRQFMNGMKDSLPSKTMVRNGYGFIDTDDDGSSELVVVDSLKIKWFDFKGEMIKQITPLCTNFQLQVYKAGHGLAIIGGTCRDEEIITAYDNNGNDVARIKLTADSPFTVADINNDNKYEIIYCYRNRIFVYTLR